MNMYERAANIRSIYIRFIFSSYTRRVGSESEATLKLLKFTLNRKIYLKRDITNYELYSNPYSARLLSFFFLYSQLLPEVE